MAFRKPGTKRIGGKFLSYGIKATGKTTFLLSFPGIAAIDTEAGMSFYENTEKGKNLVIIGNSQSFKELEEDIDDIGENFKEYNIQTFGIDSATKIKENLEETIMVIDEKRERKKGKSVDETNLSIRSRGRIKYVAKRLQNLKIDLSTKGVHIVDISQAKAIKEKQGDQYITVGWEPDMPKGADHDYDVVLRHFTSTNVKGETIYKAEVEKDRLEIFKKGDIIENPSYEMWREKIELRKDAEALNTSFSSQINTDKEKYEEEADLEEKTMKEKITILVSSLDDQKKEEFKVALKDHKITSFENLPPAKQSKLQEIYNEFSK